MTGLEISPFVHIFPSAAVFPINQPKVYVASEYYHMGVNIIIRINAGGESATACREMDR